MNKRIFELLSISILVIGGCTNSPKKKSKHGRSGELTAISSSSKEITSDNPTDSVTSSNSSNTTQAPTSASSTSTTLSGTSSSTSSSSTSIDPDVDSYYSTIKESDSGTSLRDKLMVIVNTGFTKIDYGNKETESKGAMRICDRNWDLSPDEDDPNPYMYLLYLKDNKNKPHRYDEVENAWNKEHIWAKSNGFPSEGQAAHCDLHHLRASDKTNNSMRNNFCFDDLTSSSGASYVQDANGDNSGMRITNVSYMPQACDRGDVARALFYMATKYADKKYGTSVNLQLKNEKSSNNSGGWWGNLDVLLRWHQEDPVDTFETRRNNLIYERYQHNRNPFIDHPEYAARIWG